MPHFFLALAVFVLLASLAGCARSGSSDSNLTVRTRGDATVYGVYRSGWR